MRARSPHAPSTGSVTNVAAKKGVSQTALGNIAATRAREKSDVPSTGSGSTAAVVRGKAVAHRGKNAHEATRPEIGHSLKFVCTKTKETLDGKISSKEERELKISRKTLGDLSKVHDRSTLELPAIPQEKIALAKQVVSILKKNNRFSTTPRITGGDFCDQIQNAYKTAKGTKGGFPEEISHDQELFTLVVLFSCNRFNDDGIFGTIPGGLYNVDENFESKVRTIGRYFIGEIKGIKSPEDIEKIGSLATEFRGAELGRLLEVISPRDVIKISYPEYCHGENPIIKDWLLGYRDLDPESKISQGYKDDILKRLVWYELKHHGGAIDNDGNVIVENLPRALAYLERKSTIIRFITGIDVIENPDEVVKLVIPNFSSEILTPQVVELSDDDLFFEEKPRVIMPDFPSDYLPVVVFRERSDGKNVKRYESVDFLPIDSRELRRVRESDKTTLPTINKRKKANAQKMVGKIKEHFGERGVTLSQFKEKVEEINETKIDDEELLALIVVLYKQKFPKVHFPVGFCSDERDGFYLRIKTAMRLFVEDHLNITSPKDLEDVPRIVNKLDKFGLHELVKAAPARTLLMMGYPEYFVGSDAPVRDYAIEFMVSDSGNIVKYKIDVAKRAFYRALLDHEVIDADGTLNVKKLLEINFSDNFGGQYNKTLITMAKNRTGSFSFGSGIKLVVPGFDLNALKEKRAQLSSEEVAIRTEVANQKADKRAAAVERKKVKLQAVKARAAKRAADQKAKTIAKFNERLKVVVTSPFKGYPPTCTPTPERESLFKGRNDFRLLATCFIYSLRDNPAKNSISLVNRMLHTKNRDNLYVSNDDLKRIFMLLAENIETLDIGLKEVSKGKFNSLIKDLSELDGADIRSVLDEVDKAEYESTFPDSATRFECLDYLIGFTAGLDMHYNTNPNLTDLDPADTSTFLENALLAVF